MMLDDKQLKKTLTVTQATGLGITIVVGSGLLLLPGLAYRDAGGVAGFMQNAFSRRAAAATEIMLLGTFGLGIPAIALTGSYYVNILLPPAWQSDTVTLALFLILVLLLIPLAALLLSQESLGAGITPLWQVELGDILPLLGMVFFAFTGWEMLSFTIEEYRQPERDYPISVALSFLIVVSLYLLLVIAVQLLIAVDDPLLATAPLAALAQHTFGAVAGILVALLSFVIILANLISAVWAASRLIFHSSRESLLPASISHLSVDKIPRAALSTACVFFAFILVANYYGALQVNDLLRLAEQNFFILYGMAVLAFIKISVTCKAFIFGTCSLVIVVVTMGTFGVELLYPLCLLAFGYALGGRGQHHHADY